MPNAGTSQQTGDTAFSQTQQTTFKPASESEQALLDQFKGLGGQQLQALQQVLNSAQGSAFTLSPQDQASLDQAYQGALNQYNTQAKDYGAYLAGGRGMRMSDTPVAQQAIERYGLGLGNIMSEKARAGLELGLAGNQFKVNAGLMGAQALPSGLVSAFNPLYNERMASGVTSSSGTGRSSQSYTQPLMQTIMQGTQAFNTALQPFASFGTGGAQGFGNFLKSF